MRILEGLKPERVFYYFEDLCAIPHGSGNTDKISDYCVEFAKAHNLDYIKDEHNNVIIRKAASEGYESHETVIVQGHLDMVCEKEPDLDFDFLKDGLNLCADGDLVYAKGTTLGGDDGIAIAMALAILEDNTLSHPPIEALFTTDEETGMYGAEGLDATKLKGKTLLNIDSEAEGILTVSCAGGARAAIEFPLIEDKPRDACYKVTLTGLAGGHSGVEINNGLQNANVMLGKFLSSLPFEYKIADICGGLKDNAIPRQAVAVIFTSGDLAPLAKKFIKENEVDTDPNLDIIIEKSSAESCFDESSSKAVTKFLTTVANGVQSMSTAIEGLVQTSLNLGILKIEGAKLVATFAVRSSVNEEKTALLEKLEATAKEFGGTFESHGHYPAWEYRADSRLRDTMISVYKDMYGKEPVVEAIHAGLECGLFAGKIADLDAVSFGPDLFDIHTTRERLSIASTARTYDYLCKVLAAL